MSNDVTQRAEALAASTAVLPDDTAVASALAGQLYGRGQIAITTRESPRGASTIVEMARNGAVCIRKDVDHDKVRAATDPKGAADAAVASAVASFTATFVHDLTGCACLCDPPNCPAAATFRNARKRARGG